jgi:hypothetical protein
MSLRWLIKKQQDKIDDGNGIASGKKMANRVTYSPPSLGGEDGGDETKTKTAILKIRKKKKKSSQKKKKSEQQGLSDSFDMELAELQKSLKGL